MSETISRPVGPTGSRGGGGSRLSEQQRYYDDVGNKVRLLADTSPWLASQPDVMQALAMNPALGYADLAYNSAALAAQVSIDGMANNLSGLTPAAQRAVFNQLTVTQRNALSQLGYEPPSAGGRNPLMTALGPLGVVAGAGTNALGSVIGPPLGKAFDGLMWAGDRPAHLYRAVATMDSTAQIAGLIGAGVGVAGVLAAPFTGGLSLGLTATVVGAGGLAGMTLGAAATNPSSWWDSFNDSWDGERVFSRNAQARAREILGGNEELATLARDVAWEGSLIDLVEEFASVRDATGRNQIERSVMRVAERLVDPTSPQYREVAEGLMRLATDDNFAQAVRTLQDGKVSFGRTVARTAGLNPGDAWYGRVSGAFDGLWLVALDPTFAAFGVSKIVKASRYAVPFGSSREVTTRALANSFESRDEVRNAFRVLGEAVEAGEFQTVRQFLPNAQDIYMPLNQYRARKLALDPDFKLGADQVLDFFTETEGILSLMQGRYMRPGADKVLLPSLGPVSYRWGQTKGVMKSVIDFSDDAQAAAKTARAAERSATRAARKLDKTGQLITGDTGLSQSLIDVVDAAAYDVRRRFRVTLEESERAVIDRFLELMDDYAVRRLDEGFLGELTRVQLASVRIAQAKGLADDFTSEMMDAFNRMRRVPDSGPGDFFEETRRLWNRQVVDEIPGLDPRFPQPGLAPTAHPVVGHVGMEVRDAAVSANRHQVLRAIVNWVDGIPGLSQIQGSAGALFGSFTAQIPTRAINMNSAKDIAKFVDLGRVMGVSSEVRQAWSSMIINQTSPAQRILAAEAYIDTMLRAGGIDVLPEGVDLANRFLVKYHQSYALNGLDELFIGGYPRRVGLMPTNDQALDLVIPNLRELRQAVARGTVMKWMLGASDHALIEQSMSRVWKPAILLRIGFIPRAAGEELMAYVARNGIGSMMAEMGETTVWRGEIARSEPAVLAHFDAKELTTNMIDQVLKWRTMSHVRPIERMFSRMDFRPGVAFLEAYSDSMRTWLARGVAPQLSERMSPATRKMLLGDEGTFRRLMLMGSDPEAQKAVGAFEKVNAGPLARQWSARNQGWYEKADQHNVVKVLRRGDDGKLVEEQMIRLRNEFRWYGVDDPYYANAFHEQLNHEWSDPLVIRAAIDTLARVLPESVDENNLRSILSVMRDHGGLLRDERSTVVSRLMRDVLDKDRLDDLDKAEIRRTLERIWTRLDSEGADEIAGAFEAAIRSLDKLPATSIEPREMIHAMSAVLSGDKRRAINEVLDVADNLDEHGRAWFALQLEHGTWTPDDLSAALLDTSQFVLSQSDARIAMSQRILELMNDPRFNGRVNWSLQGAVVNDLPVLNPLTEGFERTYMPAVDTDAVARFADEILATVPEAGPEGIAAVVDNMMSWFVTAMDDMVAAGAPRTAMELNDVRKVFQSIAQSAENIDVLIARAAQAGHERTIPLTMAGTIDPQAAQAISRVLHQMAGLDSHVVPARIAYSDEASRYLPWGRRGPDPEPRDIVAATDRQRMAVDPTYIPPLDWDGTLGRMSSVELVPSELMVNGVLRSSAEDAMQIWADNIVERVMQVSAHQRTHMVPRTRLELRDNQGRSTMLEPYDTELGRARAVERTREPEVAPAQPARDNMPLAEGIDDYDPYAVQVGASDLPATQLEGPEHYRLRREAQYFDPVTGKPVAWGDNEFMMPVMVDGVTNLDNPITWSVVAPAMRDSMDSLIGTSMYRADGTRALRSTVDRIAHTPALELPEHVQAVAHIAHKQGTWDRMIQYGFNEVVSPAIDAIVRTPMARHHFMRAYMDGQRAKPWMLDREQMGRVYKPFREIAPPADRSHLLAEARRAEEALGLGVKMSDDELLDLAMNLSSDGYFDARRRALAIGDQTAEASLRTFHPDDAWKIRHSTAELPDVQMVEDLLDLVGDSIFGSFETAIKHGRIAQLVKRDPKFKEIIEEQWTGLQRARRSMEMFDNEITQIATQRAVANTVPFLDSHEIRSQFGEYGRNILPFWYAEENFLKRWAKTLKLAPEALRKGQLTYMGMKEVGVIRSDANGNDWFVYPGSNLLIEAFGKIPWLETMPVGAMFQAETSRMLPGFDRVGAPSAAPWLSVPMEMIATVFPEMKQAQRGIVGDIGMNRGVLRQFMPAVAMNLIEAFLQDEEASRRMSSAMVSAMAYMEANGKGLPDSATAWEEQDYVDRVRRHARSVVLAQALTAFIVPGSPSQLTTGESALSLEALTGLDVHDIGSLFNEEYRLLIQTLGIEEGTATYLDRNDTGPDGIINPLAFTTSRTQSTSGAVLPATMGAVNFYDDNRAWMEELPFAGPWLLPPDPDARGSREQYAYDSQAADGLRARRTPQEFLRSMKYKEGASIYFEEQQAYKAQRGILELNGDTDEMRRLDSQWSQFSNTYRAANPIFAEELTSNENRQRRGRIITEMRTALAAPQAPQAWHYDDMRLMFDAWDFYMLQVRQHANDRSHATRVAIDQYKLLFEASMDSFVNQRPHLDPFWRSVLRPESSLD